MEIKATISRGPTERLSVAEMDSGSISIRVELKDSTGRWMSTRKQLTLEPDELRRMLEVL